MLAIWTHVLPLRLNAGREQTHPTAIGKIRLESRSCLIRLSRIAVENPQAAHQPPSSAATHTCSGSELNKRP